MKILFVQHKDFLNGSGGMEKICTFLANHFASLDYRVEVATNQNISGNAVFPLNKNIKITNIYDSTLIQEKLQTLHNYKGKNPFRWIISKIEKKRAKFRNKLLNKKMGGADGLYEFNLKKRSEAWKNYINTINPDLIITMSISSLLEITYQNEYSIPIINSVNGRPDYDYSDILWYRGEKEMSLLKESYKNLSAIQILFDNYKDFLPDTFRSRSITIANPVPHVDENQIINHLNRKERYKIVNIASLAIDCKQQHIAINIFAKIAHKYPDWDLYFWGIGVDYDLLYHQIKSLGLKNRVFLKGFTDSPMEKLANSDIFIFPSKYEGFPLALTEAMSIGLPCIGFKNCSGVNELIKHNKNGFLAENESEMLDYLEALIQDSKLRQTLGEKANLSMKKYDKKYVCGEWEKLVTSLIKIKEKS